MSDVNFNKCPVSLSVLDKYYLIPLKKGPMAEYHVVFFHKHAVLNVLVFYLVNVYLTYNHSCTSSKVAIWVYIGYTTTSWFFLFILFCIL